MLFSRRINMNEISFYVKVKRGGGNILSLLTNLAPIVKTCRMNSVLKFIRHVLSFALNGLGFFHSDFDDSAAVDFFDVENMTVETDAFAFAQNLSGFRH